MNKRGRCYGCGRARVLSPQGVCRSCIRRVLEQADHDDLFGAKDDGSRCCVCGEPLAEVGKMVYCGPQCEKLDAHVSQTVLLQAIHHKIDEISDWDHAVFSSPENLCG